MLERWARFLAYLPTQTFGIWLGGGGWRARSARVTEGNDTMEIDDARQLAEASLEITSSLGDRAWSPGLRDGMAEIIAEEGLDQLTGLVSFVALAGADELDVDPRQRDVVETVARRAIDVARGRGARLHGQLDCERRLVELVTRLGGHRA